jgi:hypothetical protein
MKTRNICQILAVALALGLSTTAKAQTYAQTVLADSPVVFYQFNESSGATVAVDSSGNGNNGSYTSVSLGNTGATANLGTAAAFDGSSSYVATPALGSAYSLGGGGNSQATIEFWFNPQSTGGSALYANPWQLGALNYLWDWNGPGVQFSLNGAATPGTTVFDSSPAIPVDQWTHVVAVYDGEVASNVVVYVNGQPVGTNVFTATTPASFDPGQIGAQTSAGGRFFTGLMEDFAIYTQPLSGSRIQAHYLAGAGPFVEITGQPQNVSVSVGMTANFTTAATVVGETALLSYQWQTNGSDITGETNATYTTGALTLASSGTRYDCVVTAPGATLATTRQAYLVVIEGGPSTNNAYSQAVAADNPAVYYQLNESPGAAVAVDSSGNGNSGYYTNVTLGVPGPTTVLQTAAGFYTTNSFVATPAFGGAYSLGGAGNDQFTIEAWINPTNYHTFEMVYGNYPWQDGAINYQLVDSDGIRFSMNGGSPAGDRLCASFVPNQWAYVVVSYDGSTNEFRMYVNGQLFDDEFFACDARDFEAAEIGNWAGGGRQLNGLMDDVAIYTNVLSSDRVAAHYLAADGPPFVWVTNQPQDTPVIIAGQTATFTVGATVIGTNLSPTYQWQSNGVNIAGATSSSYTTPPLTVADNGTKFDCVLTAAATGALSALTRSAALSVAAATPYPSAAYQNAVLADNPVVYYRFEEPAGATDAVDSSGNGNDGAYNNVTLRNPSATALGWSVGLTNIYTSYGGYSNGTYNSQSSSYVSVPAVGGAQSLGGSGNDQFTIEGWIRPQLFTADESIYSVDDNVFGVQILWGWFANPQDIHVILQANTPAGVDFFSPALGVGQWTHVAVVYNQALSDLVVYINGAPLGTNIYTTANVVNFDPAQLGLESDGQNPPYYGLLDEFAIYTNALSTARIQDHYLAGVTAPPGPPLSIGKSGNEVTLSWNAGVWAGSGFTLQLQQNGNLQDQASWTDVPNATNSPVTLPLGSSSTFYRLSIGQ